MHTGSDKVHQGRYLGEKLIEENDLGNREVHKSTIDYLLRKSS